MSDSQYPRSRRLSARSSHYWLTAAIIGIAYVVPSALGSPPPTAATTVDAAPLQAGAWVRKDAVIHREADRVPIPDYNEQGSFVIGPSGASSTYSWSNEDTGRAGSMSTNHSWTAPPAVIVPGQTVEVTVVATLSIGGSPGGWHHYCTTYFEVNSPPWLAYADLNGYEYNPGTKTETARYKVGSGGRVVFYFGVSTSWNNGSYVEYEYEWRDSVPPTRAATATPTRTPAPTPTPAYDIQADGYEANQAIQCIDPSKGAATCADNSIPLVRGKHTVLIVRPRVVMAAGTIDATDTASFGARLVRDSPGSGSVDAFEPVGVYAASQGTAELRFRLPLAWMDAPTLRLHVELNPEGAAPETNRSNNRLDLALVTEERRSLDVMYVPIQYAPPGQIPTFPGDRIRRGATLAGKLFPLAHLGLSYRRGAPFGISFPVQTSEQAAGVIGVLQQMYVAMLFANPETAPDQLIGWLPRIPGNSITGKSDPLWLTPQGTGRVLLAQDWDAVLEARTLAHELAHNLNARHPNVDPDNCKHLSLKNERWPYADDLIQERGFDPLLMASQPPSRKDLMTYCANRWISPFTYMELFQTNGFPLAPTPKAGQSRTVLASSRPATTGPEIDSHTVAEARDWMVIRGTILRRGEGTLEPLVRLTSRAVPPPAPSGGAYCVDQRTAAASLAAICFDVDFLDDDGAPIDRETFLYVMPAEAGTTLVRLSRGSTALAERNASSNAPTLTIVVPFPEVAWSGRQTAYWQANDADGDALTYQVLYSPDGDRWLPLAVDLTEQQLAVDTDSLPGGLSARLRVIATDGFHTTVAEVGPFAVAPKGPRPVILSPEDGSMVVPGRPVLLAGGGEDPEEGPLDSASLLWSSDRSGDLGSGESLEVRNLALGDHRIRLRARDSEGNWGEDTILLHVRPHQVYLPFGLRGATRTDLPAPKIVPYPSAIPPTVPTPVPTATPWRTPTGEASATRTPTRRPTDRPTATVTPTPAVTPGPGGASVYGRVTKSSLPIGGITVELLRGEVGNAVPVATTRTTAAGDYEFQNVAAPAAGQFLVVHYGNSVFAPNPDIFSLRDWWGERLDVLLPDQRAHGGDFDIEDLALTSPAMGAEVTLPATFCWQPRSVGDGNHRLVFMDSITSEAFQTPLLGRVSCVAISGWSGAYDRAFYWWVTVYQSADPDGHPINQGYNFASRTVKFRPAATPTVVPPWIGTWLQAERH